MRKLKCMCILGVFLGACVVVSAQEEKTVQLCDPVAEPAVCVPDSIEVTFDGDTQSILEYTDFAADIEGQDIEMIVITDTQTDQVQGWSYGVGHDDGVVTISSADIEGTDVLTMFDPDFDATSAEGIEKCGDPDCTPANRTEGGGFISAIVLSFTKSVSLPLERNSIARATYQVTTDVGTDGTVIAVSTQLAKAGSPPTDVNLTVGGKSRRWETAIGGWIKQEGGGCVPDEPDGEVTCDDGVDNDCDGDIDCDDSDCEGTLVCCVPDEPDGEVTCDDGVDNDCDGAIDCDDTDCEATPTCCEPTEPDQEVTCDDGLDNDCDGLIDAADPDCECQPTEPDTELTCDDGEDNDCDGAIDCDDSDCEGTAVCCVPDEPDQEVTCDDGLDNDCDGLIDGDDPDCDVGPCDADDWALYFGSAATDQDVDLGAATEYVVTCRNALDSLGFQLGVSAATAGGTTTWEFSEALGADADRLIELIITDENGMSQTPATPNSATSDEEEVNTIERGAAIEGFSGRDFFAFDTSPGVGGPGFTVGYVADTNPPQGGGQEIPATGDESPCPTNEILRISLGVGGVQFSRGDADANGRINVSDAVLIIQIVVGNLDARFDCDKALDADDDGSLSVVDAIPVLNYVFDINGGDPLPAPFRTCGDDPTDDTLTCVETNCQ